MKKDQDKGTKKQRTERSHPPGKGTDDWGQKVDEMLDAEGQPGSETPKLTLEQDIKQGQKGNRQRQERKPGAAPGAISNKNGKGE